MTPLQEIAPIADVCVQVIAELDRRAMPIREILMLDVGSVIVMQRSAGEHIDIYVETTLIGYGEIVIIENTIGFRITDFKIEE